MTSTPKSTLKRLVSLRRVGAWLCLAAVAMLWMPALAAAWSAHVLACCDGKMCVAQGHRHGKQAQRAKSAATAPMECGHSPSESQSGAGMNCAMSCCHEQEQFAAPGMIFVVPDVAAQHVAFAGEPSIRLLDARQITVLFGPLSPPPRSISSIA